MIIDFRNMNGGGGGSGYTLPIASSEVLGGVKVGSGLTITSGGTLNSKQNYEIVSGITDFTAGKLYGVVFLGNYEEYFEGSNIFCGNLHTDFSGTVEDSSINSSFNPWVQKQGMYIDSYIDRDASTGINTLTVKYGNQTVVNETLSEGDNVFSLPTNYDLTGLTYSVNVTDGVQYYVVISGSVLSEQGYYIHKSVWNYNSNISNPVAVTYGHKDVCEIAYTDGTTSHTISTVATTGQTGLVKIGSGITVDSDGTISVDVPEINVATTATTGVVKIGSGITVDSAGTISVEAQGGGEATIVKSLEEAPTGLTDGDIYNMATDHYTPKCKVYDKDHNVLDIGSYDMDSTQPLTFESDLNTDVLIWHCAHWDYQLYIYGGKDENDDFCYDYVLTTSNVFTESGSVTDVNTSATIEFSGGPNATIELVNDGQGGLEVTKTGDNFGMFVHCNQDEKIEYLNDGSFIVKTEGERAKLEQWTDGKGCKTVLLYYGELPTNTILLKATNAYDEITTYYSWDGEKLCSWSDEYMQNRGIYDFDFNAEKGWGYDLYRFYEGILSIISRVGIDSEKWELVGNWYKYSSQTNEPLDWQSKCDNIRQFGYPLAACSFNDSVTFFGTNDIWINGVPSDGSTGQVLRRTSGGYGWESLVIPKTEIYQSLPYGGNEGDLVLTNSEYYPYTASTFISRNSTSESDRNNFSDTDDIGWYAWGGSYIYFGNASAYTNTKDTFLYKIALLTNENGDWNTSNIAYINVLRRNGEYSIFMDNFNYYDNGGTPTPYTFTMFLSSTGTTSGNTPYLPIWRWWDGGYGYKFHFELDQDNNLKMWMRHSDVDRDNQEPDYVEGQNYGEIAYRCMNHTTVFYDYINLDQDDTYLSIYKGGVWYELGYLTRQGV